MRLPSEMEISGRDLGAEELELLSRVLESGVLSRERGVQVRHLEREFACRHNVEHCRAYLSGSQALAAAVGCFPMEPGDEVILSPFADASCLYAIALQGAVPVFADVDPFTRNLTAETILARVSPRTRLLLVKHSHGQPVDVAVLRRLLPALPIVEDCSDAFLARVDGRQAGTMGDIGVFRLDQGAHMTAGEGGLAITDNAELAGRLDRFIAGNPSDASWGERMTELQAAVARAQLRKLEGAVARRQRAAAQMSERLMDLDAVTLPVPAPGSAHVYRHYVLRVNPELIHGGAAALAEVLMGRGVACSPGELQRPLSEHPVVVDRRIFGQGGWPFSLRPDVVYRPEDLPNAYDAMENSVILPWNEFYAEEHIEYLAMAVRDAVLVLTNVPAPVL